MSRRVRHAIAVVAAAAWLSPAAGAQQPSHDHDAHHRDVLARGEKAMGFDQERTVHHFLLDENGGTIDVAVKDAGDHANLHAIRTHLEQIAGSFKAGDFDAPALTHARVVPGTADMARLRDRITYQYEETSNGGRVRIVTRDAEARAAVHAFLRFQIEDHRSGDSGVGPRSASEPATHGRGQGMMGRGQDAAMMAEMGDIHELFANHDRITRTVTNLPNGIRTGTESADRRVARLIKDHVTSMEQRVQSGRDPGLPIESEALRSIYRNYDKIHTTVQPTATGIVVVQTSSDAQTVAALQQHAAEVTAFVKEGMAATHAAMMKNGGMMQRGMRGRMMGTPPQGK